MGWKINPGSSYAFRYFMFKQVQEDLRTSRLQTQLVWNLALACRMRTVFLKKFRWLTLWRLGLCPLFGLVYKLTPLFVQDKPAVPPREYHDPMSDAKVRQNMFLWGFSNQNQIYKHIRLKLCMREVAHAHEPAPECPSSMCEARFNLWFPLYQEERTFGSWVVGTIETLLNPSPSPEWPWAALRFPILTWQAGPAAETLPPQTRPEVEDIGAAKLSGQTPYHKFIMLFILT